MRGVTENAKAVATGRRDEGEVQRSALCQLENLQLVSIGAGDDVLEIGCGVARIGAHHCLTLPVLDWGGYFGEYVELRSRFNPTTARLW